MLIPQPFDRSQRNGFSCRALGTFTTQLCDDLAIVMRIRQIADSLDKLCG
jgi:hypothetical protein